MVSQKLHACYQVPFHFSPLPARVVPVLHKQQSWQHKVLSIYNPVFETTQLKQARNKTDAFVQLRAAHVNRHDFSVYGKNVLNLQAHPEVALDLCTS